MRSRFPRLSGVNYESFVDGEGVRTVFFFSGCPHHCPGCHNPETWNRNAGVQADEAMIQTMADEINKRSFLDGITLSGGDPFYQPQSVMTFLGALLKCCHRPLTVWCYTGYQYEELNDPFQRTLLSAIDVLVDGKFEQEKADRSLAFRGSKNQRIIDVRETKKQNKICLWKGGGYDA